MSNSWPYTADRSYHGYREPQDPFRLVIELSEFGPTERQVPFLLRVPTSDVGEFGWGYNGTGTSATADAILRDALELGAEDTLDTDLREDFCEDLVAHFPREFIIRRGAVLRWVRGWAADRDVRNLPLAAANPPPVDRLEYERRPDFVRHAQDQARKARGL